MNASPASPPSSRSPFRLAMPILLLSAISAVVSGVIAAGVVWRYAPRPTVVAIPANSTAVASGEAMESKGGEGVAAGAATTAGDIHFPEDSWKAASLQIQPATRGALVRKIRLTGKVALNSDHVAHIFPLVSGRVDEVRVSFGDRVKKDELLVVVQSQEVGESMLDLYQSRLQREFVETKDKWIRDIDANTRELIQSIVEQKPVDSIEQSFTNRPMGEYRDKLLSAYVSLRKTTQTLDRLTPLSQQGVTAAKQLFEAEAERNADKVRLQSWIETIQQESRHAVLVSAQAVKEARTRVAVNETNLQILGFKADELQDIDPTKQGEAISHYPIKSPFDGVIISKDVVLLERVNPDSQILSIADLSTVWITTDIFEEHLPLLEKLAGRTITVRSDVWPGKEFPAKVFYTGDIVDESTRTIGMRASAENREGLLRPGMFVNVELPEAEADDVLQISVDALQEHEGKTFVFLHVLGDVFQRRDVKVGRKNAQFAEIVEGLSEGDRIVVQGGFSLKSRMLADLLSGE
jgi:cobalt-zinc-cadmium efflux system membrane fusion protein